MNISARYFKKVIGREPTPVQLEHCNSLGGWCWEKNQPSWGLENVETDYKTRYARLLEPLYTLQADGPRAYHLGVCFNLELVDNESIVYRSLVEIFSLMGYEHTDYPLELSATDDLWKDGRRMRLVQQLINFCEGKDYERI